MPVCAQRIPQINLFTGNPAGTSCSVPNSLVQSTTTGGIFACVGGVYVSPGGSSAGVASINSATGAFTFNFSSGAGSCSGTTCTFNASSGACLLTGCAMTGAFSGTSISLSSNFTSNGTIIANGNMGVEWINGGTLIANISRETTGVVQLGTGGTIGNGGSLDLTNLTASGSVSGASLSLTSPTTRRGTFTCTAAGTITVAATPVIVGSDILITLEAAGGVITTTPAIKTLTAGTGFSVLCGSTDTSVYRFTVLN
jgi:hypothetical protein